MAKKQEKTDFKKEFEELKNEYDDIKNSLQRLQAEFVNFRNRTDEEKKRTAKYASKDLILKILPVLDNLELALKHNKEDTEFYKGVEMIYAQINEILSEEGLEKIPTNVKFDPNLHEAVLAEQGKENNTILEELQSGYKIGEQIVRHSKVKISKKGDKK